MKEGEIMFRKIKLMWRILLLIGLPIVITFVLVIVLATTSFVTREKENAAELVDYLASAYAQEIKANLDVAMDAVRTIAQIFETSRTWR
jgi:sensor histidine kinase regulating citrate/malate metabolism